MYTNPGPGNALYFAVNPSAVTNSNTLVEAMRIMPNGRVGIGTQDPDHRFEVEDNNSSIATSRTGSNAQLLFKSNSVAQASQIQVSESNGGGVFIVSTKRTTANGAALTERFRIDDDGRIDHFSHTNNGYDLHMPSNSSEAAYVVKQGSTNLGDGTISYTVSTNGNVTNTNNSYGQISDASLKENIVDANSQWDDIKAIKVRNFNFKESTNHLTHTQIGVVAQEIETVSPSLVEDTSEGIKSVKYSVLYMKAVKALQEAMTKIESLEARVTELEG